MQFDKEGKLDSSGLLNEIDKDELVVKDECDNAKL